MQHGAYTVGDGMRRHLVSLERERQNLEAAIRFCGTLTDRRERLEELEQVVPKNTAQAVFQYFREIRN